MFCKVTFVVFDSEWICEHRNVILRKWAAYAHFVIHSEMVVAGIGYNVWSLIIKGKNLIECNRELRNEKMNFLENIYFLS